MEKIIIDLNGGKGCINPNVYGHFAEHIGGVIYDGLWVGEDSPVENIRGFRKAIVEDLKQIKAPVLRWPGGCFAEGYDWRDGIGPRDQRPIRLNWWNFRDLKTESNQVGTHEFNDLCRMIGAEPYFALNVSTVDALHGRDWVEYCNFPGDTTLTRERAANGDKEPLNIQYWGIGNENWGGGGNMTPDHYADHYRKYCQAARNASMDSSFIACGPNGNDLHWTEEFFKRLQGAEVPLYGYSAHFYCGTAGDALHFDRDQWYQLIARSQRMETLINQQWTMMGRYDVEHKVKLIIDEWGCWHPDGSGPSKGGNLFEQQSCMRDAVVAASTLNIFNNHCDKVAMANVAQVVNNLHSLFLAAGDQYVRTPNYYVFDMYKAHQGAECLRTQVACGEISFQGDEETRIERLSASASIKDGVITLTVANVDYDHDAEFIPELLGGSAALVGLTVLSCDSLSAVNDFQNPNLIVSRDIDVSALTPNQPIRIPKGGVASLTFKG